MSPFPKAVIFDLDGTLLNTIDDLADSCNYVLSTCNHPTHPTEKYLYFVGNGIQKLAQRILPEGCRSDEQVAKCVSLISNHYNKNWKSKTTVYSGIKELLVAFNEKKVPIAILSNKNEICVQTMVGYFFEDISFEYVFGAVDNFEKKPDEGRALYLADKLKTTPAHIMFVGDSKVDMQTARNAGMISVGVTWGFRTRQELQEHDAQIIIDTPWELLDQVSP